MSKIEKNEFQDDKNSGEGRHTMRRWVTTGFIAVFLLIACGGEKEQTRDVEISFDTEVVTDEEKVDDTGNLDTGDADIVPSSSQPSGEQTWFGALPTGQTRCYDNEKEIPCPQPGEPFFGQDAQFNQWKTRSFIQGTGSSAGTVYDDVTQLTWQLGYEEGLTWAEANGYCAGLSLAGRKWRLPTPHELKSLINYGKIVGDMPVHPATDFPGETPNDWFWATGRIQDTTTAWIVYFYDGELEYTEKTNRYSVRCVAVK